MSEVLCISLLIVGLELMYFGFRILTGGKVKIMDISTDVTFNKQGNYTFKYYSDGSLSITYNTRDGNDSPNHLACSLNLNSKEVEILKEFLESYNKKDIVVH